jgi:ABC-type polysaccharide/polyol phosphate transport system ATPase subunit
VSTTLDTPRAPRPGGAAAAPPAIEAQAVSKVFRLPHRRYNTLKERALHPLQGRTFDDLHAVDDLSFTVEAGEFFGIVGRNGSGKSTLLKCMAGIYEPNSGHIEVRGRLSPFIELGVGFNPELTARENVIINAIMLGLSRREAQRRFDEVIAFAELEEFLDLKLKNYSSGMQVRLAFAVAVQVDADVILVDEVLAVGDAAFQQKCFEQFERMKREGRTIVLVTHDMNAVRRFCHRALLIEHGRMVEIGDPATIARRYNELNFGTLIHDAPGGERPATPAAEIKSAWFEAPDGRHIVEIQQGEPCAACFEVAFHEAVEDPVFALNVINEPRHTVFATSSQWRTGPTGRFEAGSQAVVRVGFENWLAPMRYTLTPSVAAGPGELTLDLREDLASIVVHAVRHTGGIADVPHTLTITTA